MKYSVVSFPGKPLQDLANSYRKRYDPHYGLIPPHIMLINGFEAKQEQIISVVQTLHEVSNHTTPFDINITKFSSFQPVNSIIYLKIEPKEDFKNLYTKIVGAIPNYVHEHLFVPYIAIGQELSNDEHSDVFGSLKMLQINQQDSIDRFHLLYQLENGSWTVYETFRFRKD
jgi:2'-5' RNA ligase